KSVTTWTVFRPPKKRGFPASLKPCALGAMSCRRLTKAWKKIRMTSSFLLLGRPRRGRAEMKAASARLYLRHRCLEAATHSRMCKIVPHFRRDDQMEFVRGFAN